MNDYEKTAYKVAVLEAVVLFIDTTEFSDEEFLPQSKKAVPAEVKEEMLKDFDTLVRELREGLTRYEMTRREDEQPEAKERKPAAKAQKRPASKAGKADAKLGGKGKAARASRRAAK